ncbi:MAG: hypothetical protein ABIQ95_13785 [Bdellovibrionia bacterium]
MQKFNIIWTLFYLSLSTFVPANCYAELWQGAKALPKLDSSFGIHTQLYQDHRSQAPKIMAFGQFDYGQTDQIQIETRLGLGNLNYYLGLFSKYQIHSDSNWDVAVMGGIQLQSYFSLVGDLIGSIHFDSTELYSSIHFFTPLQGSAMGVGLIHGFDFKLSQWMVIYLEANVNLANYYTAGSLGFRHFF